MSGTALVMLAGAIALYLPVRRRRWHLLAAMPELIVVMVVLALVFVQGALVPE